MDYGFFGDRDERNGKVTLVGSFAGRVRLGSFII